MIQSLSFRCNSNERRLKRVCIMAEQFITGLLSPVGEHDWIYGFKFEDELGTLPPETRVESFWFEYNPSCFMVMLSNPAWPEVEPGESPPFLRGERLALTKAFVNREKYAEQNASAPSLSPVSLETLLRDATADQLAALRSRVNEELYDRERRK